VVSRITANMHVLFQYFKVVRPVPRYRSSEMIPSGR